MTDLSILAEKRGAASLASLILSFLIALPGAPIALAADEQAIHFKPLTDPQDAALVRTLLDETEGTLPAENLVIARFEDLPIRVIRVENQKYCEKADCINMVLVEGLSPLRIMASSHVMNTRGPGTALLRFLRQCAEVTLEITPMAFRLTSKPQKPCSIP